MNNDRDAYCRFCAELKPADKLFNLQTNEQDKEQILQKLTRINKGYQDVFSDRTLPKTVCIVCISELERAYDFVVRLDQAQSVLNDVILVPQIKKESISSEKNSDSELDYEPTEDEKLVDKIVVKLEATNSEETKTPIIKSKAKKLEARSLDAIPLSQLKLTWKDYTWMCSFCEMQFLNIEELRNHTMKYHDSCHAYRCIDCNIRKMRLDIFLGHVKRHRKYLKLSCYLCNKKFATSRKANAHKMEHIKTKHICHGCNTNFSTADDLKKHMNTYNKDKRRKLEMPLLQRLTDSLTCPLCKKTFKTKVTLTTHLLTHMDRKRDHTCDKCGKCYYYKNNLLDHMASHYDTRPYKCEICKFSCKTLAMLRSHLGVHGGQKPFRCSQCGRCFRLKKQLNNHSIIHTDSFPYVCSYCNKKFRFKSSLKQHIRQHTGVKPYKCSQCERDFTCWPNYNTHMKRMHSMDMAKKKHTPDVVHPIDPKTGEVIVYPATENIEERKQKMLAHKKRGKRRVNSKVKANASDLKQIENVS